jgi:integrase
LLVPIGKGRIKLDGTFTIRQGGGSAFLVENLYSKVELGVPDKVIQAILRHEDVSTTQRSYIKTVPEVVTNAMKQLEARIARAAVVQQVSVN